MAGRIRTIKPELLEDEVSCGLSDTAWRVWLSSWLLADDYGNLRARDAFIAAQVWQDTSKVAAANAALEELQSSGLVTLYYVAGQRYASVNGWSKHQRVDHQGKPRVPGPDHPDAVAHCMVNSRDSRKLSETFGKLPKLSDSCGKKKSDVTEEENLAASRARAGSRASDLRPPTTTTTTTTDPILSQPVATPPDSDESNSTPEHAQRQAVNDTSAPRQEAAGAVFAAQVDPTPVGKPKRARKANPEPTEPSGFKEVCAYWFSEFERVRGAKPSFASKDGKAIKTLLADLGSKEKVCEVIKNALADNWWRFNCASLPNLAGNPNRFLGQGTIGTLPFLSRRPAERVAQVQQSGWTPADTTEKFDEMVNNDASEEF